MKTLKTLLLLITLGNGVWAQSWQLESDLFLSQPTAMMRENMNNAFGFNLGVARSFKGPFSLGVEFGVGNYGYQTTRQQYTFSDGSLTETDVNVGNNIFTALLTGKHFPRNNKSVKPYLSGRLGWTVFSTNLTIEDPADELSCHPLESEIIARDNTWIASGGAGVRIDFNNLFPKTEVDRFYFDFSVHATRGGIIEYMNVDIHSPRHVPDQDVMARFLNTQTQVVHEHHVGYVYSDVFSMVEYRLGVAYRVDY